MLGSVFALVGEGGVGVRAVTYLRVQEMKEFTLGKRKMTKGRM